MYLRFSMLFLLFVLSLPAWAQQPIVPVPPKFTLDKQLTGEDQFSVSRPTFSVDSKLVAAFMHSTKTVTVWDTSTGKVVGEVKGEAHGFDGVDGLEFSNDASQVILIRNKMPLTYVDWKTGKVVRQIEMNADPRKIPSYDFNKDQSLLVLGTFSQGVQVWDLKAGKKIKQFLPDQAISSVDYITYKTKQGKWVRKIAWGRMLMANAKFENVAGIIDLDSGANSNVLTDVPADKLPPEGAMTAIMVNWQWGGGYLLVSYYQFPPKIPAGIFQVDANTKKYVSVHKLGQKTINFNPKYLWKPYYGLSMSTIDMSQPMEPYKLATEFIIFTKTGLKSIDLIDEKELPIQSINFNADNTRAVITTKKGGTDSAKIYIYKVTPKK